MTSLGGGIGLMGAIAGLLALTFYRDPKFGLFGRIDGTDLSLRHARYWRSEQYSFYPVLQLG
jgi:hypothetical protein